MDTGRGYTRGFVPAGVGGYGYGSRFQTRAQPAYPTRVPAGSKQALIIGNPVAENHHGIGCCESVDIPSVYIVHIFDNKTLFMLEILRVYPTGLETRGWIEDPRVTRTGFRPDPYAGTVFAGPGTGTPEGTRGYTRVHPT
ncbi:hypothetical protein B0H19DRAFT_1062447 [Mycena capillaripes]|nr:hypothetical protein B0H19DRAFT_1062447 [Mycena capillaripes]